jgi:hypothetical protein
MRTIKRRGPVLTAVALGAALAGVFAGAPAQAASDNSLSQSWGSASVSANAGAHQGSGFSLATDVAMTVTVTDRAADSKCVYVEFRIITSHGSDQDSTIAKACDHQQVTRAVTRVVGNGVNWIARPTAVEFKMCKAVWGVDPCQKVTVRL